jgi:hypothetical protein
MDGGKLRATRKVRLPAGAFARASGVSLRKAERGEPVKHATACKIGAALDVDPKTFAFDHLTPSSIEPQGGFTCRGVVPTFP